MAQYTDFLPVIGLFSKVASASKAEKSSPLFCGTFEAFVPELQFLIYYVAQRLQKPIWDQAGEYPKTP